MARNTSTEPPEGVPPESPAAPADENAPPKFETPAAADPGGTVPRVIRPIERAPKGFTRFKIKCLNYHPPARPWKYILAKEGDEAGARQHYLEVTGVAAEAKRLAKNKSKDAPAPEDPDIYVTVLLD